MKLLSSVLLIGACAIVAAQDYDLIEATTSALPQTSEAEYSCMFINSWSGARHPNDYPGDQAHWSSPIIFSHDSSYHVWQGGVLALPGVESLAEVSHGHHCSSYDS